MEILTKILSQIPSWLSALTTIVTAASAVAAATPTPKDDKFLGKIYRVIDVLALNVGHAKDAPSDTARKS
jgi:hypothetical protein